MKKLLLHAICLAISLFGFMGGVNTASAKTASVSVAVQNVEDDGDKDDVTAGDVTNTATFSWSGTTLTVTGKGDLSKITVTDNDTKVFSATGAGKVYTKTTTGEGEAATTTATAVKQGDKYDANSSYYEATFTYTGVYTAATAPTAGGTGYSVASKVKASPKEGYTLYNCYFDTNVKNVYTTGTVDLTDGYFTQGVTNLDQKQGDYHYYCLVKGTLPTNVNNTFSIASGLGSETGDYHIILLTDENFSTYIQNQVVITSSNDNLYVKDKDSDTYTNKPSGTSWTYVAGQTIYTGEASVAETAIADNDTYFGTTHSDYIESAVLSFADYLPIAITSDINTVVFKTDANVVTNGDNSKKANINNEITRALVKIKSIETLNLQDTYLENIEAHNPSKTDASYKPIEDPTFYLGELGKYNTPLNTTLKTLYMPTTGTKELVKVDIQSGGSFTVFQFLTGLKELHLGEGIETIGEGSMVTYTGNETVDGNYVERKFILSSITFPNTLKEIKKSSFDGQTDILVFTFPASLEHIEAGAFQSTNPRDVYFLGLEAPKVDANAWGDNSYISNNSLNPLATTTLSDGATTGIEVSLQKGVATRSTYYTGNNGWMTMLHYPAACSKAQAAKYTDQTRTYVKIDYGKETDLVKSATDAQGVTLYEYAAGKETSDLKGKTASTSSQVAVKTFFNRYSDGTFTGGDYTGGYNDIFVGSQYIWPSMGMAYRATVVAQLGLLWNGTTSIKEGITSRLADGEKYEGEGKEYIGLHQFVFAQGDVQTDKTDEWDVTKYADGEWHSICLPFNVTKKMMKETFGPNAAGEYKYRVCKFHKVDRTDEKLKLYFNEEYYDKAESDEAIVMNAHVSYMIKAKKENIATNEKVVIKNYVMVAGSPLPTNVTVNETGSGSEGETGANQYYFVGNYASGITIPQYSYFFSKNKKYFRFQAGTTAKWNGYTSVVEAPNGEADYNQYFKTGSDAKLSTIWNDEDETTGIENVTIIAGDEIVYTSDNVYNLSGQLVSTKGMNGLPKGIYVQNGKKYIVR